MVEVPICMWLEKLQQDGVKEVEILLQVDYKLVQGTPSFPGLTPHENISVIFWHCTLELDSYDALREEEWVLAVIGNTKLTLDGSVKDA